MAGDAHRIAPAAGDPLAAEDPHGALRRCLAAPLDPLLAAEEIVMAWLLSLPDHIDPAHAAGRILAAVDLPEPAGDERLARLLAEITRWPADRLRHASCRHPTHAQ